MLSFFLQVGHHLCLVNLFNFFISSQTTRVMDHSHIFPARQWCLISRRLVPRQPLPTATLTKVSHFIPIHRLVFLHPHRNFAMAAATFMNSNSLPVALLQSLAATVPGLRWGEDDTKDAIIGRALTYLLLCSTIGQFVSVSVSSFGVMCPEASRAIIASLELWCSSTFQGRSRRRRRGDTTCVRATR